MKDAFVAGSQEILCQVPFDAFPFGDCVMA